MRISAIKLQQDMNGLKPFEISLLKNLVILVGSNGAGKTRLLKLIQTQVEGLQQGKTAEHCKSGIEIMLQEGEDNQLMTSANAGNVQIINYSHYDAKLQVPNDYSPYVIHKAKEILRQCDYEETALNSLLLIEDMAKGYSEEFRDGEHFRRFRQEAEDIFDLQIDYDENERKLQLFGRDITDEAELSPGQQYLLRMAVACFQNEDKPNLIFFMDEPELHLHPKALIELLERLRKKFPESQFWISTHSLALVSFFAVMEKDSAILHLQKGKLKRLRSDSSELLDGLIGNEKNQFAMQQLMMTPDAYASNRFAFECFDPPPTLPGKDGNDAEVEMIRTMLISGDIVVDYGAGKGRFWEELALGRARTQDGKRAVEAITYYAYSKKEIENKEDAEACKAVMDEYGSSADNYFNDFEMLRSKIGETAKYVLLVNVLHEIEPDEWKEVFENAKLLLREDGKLVIVEREELMTGESPYKAGFLMITSNAAINLFGKEHLEEYHHPKKDYLVRYLVAPEGLGIKTAVPAVKAIKKDAFKAIQQIKEKADSVDRKEKFREGIRLAFWLHQYANASILLETKNLNMKAIIDREDE